MKRPDIICGGFPCQDLSVAGKRAGLKGERSGLFYEMTRIVHELQPALLVWENVPGLLSSHGGRDFLAVLSELDRVGYCGAWTGLDAQFFGLAQRRRRVFGVFARNDLGAERCAEILSLRSRCFGDTQTGREAEPGTAACLRSRSHRPGVNPPGRGGEGDQNLVFQANGSASERRGAPSLSASDDNGSNQLVTFTELGEGHVTYQETQTAASLRTTTGGGGTRQNLVAEAYQCHGNNVGPMGTIRQGNGGTTGGVPFTVQATFSEGQGPHARKADTSKCLDSHGGNPDSQQGGTVVGFHVTQDPISGDVAPAMGTGNRQGCGTIGAQAGMMVRRLTPVECCRLQGFPDTWLDLIPPLSDSAKYRLLGNAVAVPCAAWLAARIRAVLPDLRTYLSLFAGIGGFDLGFDRAGFQCVGQAEKDADCLRVLSHHWPDVPRWTDVATLKAS